jgi:hypothetical protein
METVALPGTGSQLTSSIIRARITAMVCFRRRGVAAVETEWVGTGPRPTNQRATRFVSWPQF